DFEWALVDDGFAEGICGGRLNGDGRFVARGQWLAGRRWRSAGSDVRRSAGGVRDAGGGRFNENGFKDKAVGGFLETFDDVGEFFAEALKLAHVGSADAFGGGIGLDGEFVVIGCAFVAFVVGGNAGAADANEAVDLGIEENAAKGMDLSEQLGHGGKSAGTEGEAF